MDAAATEPFGHEKRLLLVVVTGIAITHVSVPHWIMVVVVGCVLSALALAGQVRERVPWVILALAMTIVVASSFTLVGNHAFVLTYALWAVAIHIDDQERLRNTMRWLVVIVMGIATVQKLIHPYFMSGDALAWYAASGQSFSAVVGWIDPEWTERVQRNLELARDSLGPIPASYPAFVPGGGFITMAQVLAWLVFIVEGIVAIMWVLPKRRFAPHATLAFVWATYLMRDEVYFFALLILLSLIARPVEPRHPARTDRDDPEADNSEPRTPLWWLAAATIVYMIVSGVMGIRPPFLR